MLPSLVVVLAIAAPGGATASTIVYRCPDHNLCQINPDGSGATKLTTDASGTSIYTTPSLSRDASLLSFGFGNDAFTMGMRTGARTDLSQRPVLVTVTRPDGARVALIKNVYETYPVPGFVPWIFEVNPDGSGSAADARSALDVGYLGTAVLRDGYSAAAHACTSGSSSSACPAYSICLMNPDGTCGRNVADDGTRDLWQPAGSPDGSQVAVVATPYPAGSDHAAFSGGSIAIYTASTGTLVRNLTSATGDSQPTWSPDGARIAFSRGSSIYTIAATGAPGSEQTLASGDSPTWGGGPDATPTAPVGKPGARPPTSKCHTVTRRAHGRLRRTRVCPKPKPKPKKRR